MCKPDFFERILFSLWFSPPTFLNVLETTTADSTNKASKSHSNEFLIIYGIEWNCWFTDTFKATLARLEGSRWSNNFFLNSRRQETSKITLFKVVIAHTHKRILFQYFYEFLGINFNARKVLFLWERKNTNFWSISKEFVNFFCC